MSRLKAMPSRLQPMPQRLVVQHHAGAEREKQRGISSPYRRWYKTARWQRLREIVFARDLFTCRMVGCGVVIAEKHLLTCDHVIPHRGDERLFWDEGNLQTLCKPCHDRRKQAEERRAGW